MLIDTVKGFESRIAIVIDGVLEELYIERASNGYNVSNIYKGKVTNVEPSIQAAFVDFGHGKNGFLHISDLSHQYFPKAQQKTEPVGRKRSHRERPPIQECLRRGQEVVVQLTKEGIGTKGPTLTTYLSVPGRLLVMMPGMTKLGISRKIEDEEARLKSRKLLGELKLPPDIGFIVRTAGIDKSKRELQRDLNYLLRLWKGIKKRIKSCPAPCEIYRESDLVIRTSRDIYNSDIDRIICDNESVARRVKEFLDAAMPRSKNLVEVYKGREGLFHDYGLEGEIEKIYSRRVELPSGGSLVIDQTEALVAVDVNSGKYREHSDAETTALKINTEAAKEIARQLRLRDLGGVVAMDFIDMREEKNRRTIEKTVREAIKKDRAKSKVLKMSSFGIIEMTRQRVRPSLKHSFYETCNYCKGSGLIKSEESQSLAVMRCLRRACAHEDIQNIEIVVTPAVQNYLVNDQRQEIGRLEDESGKKIMIRSDMSLGGDDIRVTCRNARGSKVTCEHPEPKTKGQIEVETVDIRDIPETPEPLSEQKTPEKTKAETKPKAKKMRKRSRRSSKKQGKATQEETKPKSKDLVEKKQEEAKKSAPKKAKRGPRRRSRRTKPKAQGKDRKKAED